MHFEKLLYVAISSIIILIFILIGNIISPNSSSQSDIIKKIYYVDHISDGHKRVIAEFNKKYKGEIEVVPINLPFEKFSTNERKELLTRYLRSKSDRIDIFSVDQIWVPKFAKWGIDFEPLLSQSQKDNLLGVTKETSYYQKAFVAVPLYIDVSLLYYRDDLLKNLPDYSKICKKLDASITWDDFIKLHVKIKNSGSKFYLFQADDYEGLVCNFFEMVLNQNPSYCKGDKIRIYTPQAEKALTLLCDLVNKYKLSPKEVTYYRELQSYKYYLNNNGYFLRGWPGFTSTYNKFIINNPEMANNLKKAPTPHFDGFNPCSVFGGWNLMISKNSTKTAEALKFINFMLSEESQKTLYELEGYLPVNKKIYEDSVYVQKHPELKFYNSLLLKGVNRPFLENYTNMSDILCLYLNQAIEKNITPKEALMLVDEKINSSGK